MSACVLAIETCTPLGRVAVWQNGGIVFSAEFQSQRSHNSQLFGPLGEALDACGAALDLIVAGTGPGSYTGVRIGIAAAQGLAWSRKVPIIGLPSVVVPDAEGLPTEFTVCGDARRGQFYAAAIRQGTLSETPIPLMSSADLALRRDQSPGETWFTFDDKIPAGLANVVLVKPSAERLAVMAASLTDEARAVCKARMLEPVYLSEPFITQAKKKSP